MKKKLPKFLAVLIILIISSSLCFSQKRHSRERSRWADTTGTADLSEARKQFWDSLPDPMGLTTDFENIYSKEERKKLDSVIVDYEKKTSVEFCIVTMDTMKVNRDRFSDLPAYIEKSWGIGKKDKQNGIVICLSIGYRAIRIGTGRGVDDYLDDRDKTQIIQKNILPEFKKGKYFNGTLKGLTAIIEILDKRMKFKTSASR